MARKAPRQGVDLNDGVYRTDKKFLQAVSKEFLIVFDLASSDDNCVVSDHFTVRDDALSMPWHLISKRWFSWLNPPYDNIGRWAKKCAEEMEKGARILFLVPASVGSNWYRDYVHGKAEVRFLNGRLIFEGHTQPYPKDLMLVIYEKGRAPTQTIWNWRNALV